jgi:hypothetical protein
MPDVVITGSLGRDVFTPPVPRAEVSEELIRSFREYFEYELTYNMGLSSDIAIAINRPTRLKIDQKHEDAWKISMSDLNRLLDKALSHFLKDRTPEQQPKPSSLKS